MSIPTWLINLFPLPARVYVQAILPFAFLGVALMLWGAYRFLRRRRREGVIQCEAQQMGLSPASARFVSHQIASGSLVAARELLHGRELLADLLVERLKSIGRTQAAARFAERAATLLAEMGGQLSPIDTRSVADAELDGAPQLFQGIALSDPTQPDAPVVCGYVTAIDGESLTIVSTDRCPWPTRRSLLVTAFESEPAPFEVVLLLRPMPGAHEWTLSHGLAGDLANRRTSPRVPVRIDTWALSATERVGALRERLRRGDRLLVGKLKKTDGWVDRHHVTIEDLSPDGVGLSVDHEVVVGDRFFVILPADDERPGDPGQAGESGWRRGFGERQRIAVLPLVEIVNLRSGAGGRLQAGARFCAMRLKERVAVAGLVRRITARHRQQVTAPPANG